jgi:MoaA/NifB/PqqE/SkfB family radical SAM enzyme
MWQVEENNGGLSKGILEEFAKQLQEILIDDKEVVFSGGEPLLHEHITDIVKAYSQKGFKVGLASNGALLTRELVKELVESGLKSIQLSFDSSYQETHDFLRGVKGAYEKVLEGAGYFSGYKDKVLVCAQTVISGRNIDELIDTIKFIKKDGRVD